VDGRPSPAMKGVLAGEDFVGRAMAVLC